MISDKNNFINKEQLLEYKNTISSYGFSFHNNPSSDPYFIRIDYGSILNVGAIFRQPAHFLLSFQEFPLKGDMIDTIFYRGNLYPIHISDKTQLTETLNDIALKCKLIIQEIKLAELERDFS